MSLRLFGLAQTPLATRSVRINGLTETSCAIDAASVPEEASFDLWIGAFGPIRSSVIQSNEHDVLIAFDEALASEVVSHFTA